MWSLNSSSLAVLVFKSRIGVIYVANVAVSFVTNTRTQNRLNAPKVSAERGWRADQTLKGSEVSGIDLAMTTELRESLGSC